MAHLPLGFALPDCTASTTFREFQVHFPENGFAFPAPALAKKQNQKTAQAST